MKKREFNRGECSSTDVAIQKWIVHNGLEMVEPVTEMLPDTAPGDGCTVEKTVWQSADKKGSVVLFKVIGGGHTLPGGVQYLPERIIGRTCQDFDAVDAIWAFFEAGSD